MNFSTVLGGLMTAAVLTISTQAMAHDHLPDMKSGVWKMNSTVTFFYNGSTNTEIKTDTGFNIDYFLGSELICVKDICRVENSASDSNTIYPAIGRYVDGRIMLSTDLGDEVKTETYIPVSNKVVLLSGSIINKLTKKPRVIYQNTFMKIE